MGSENETVWTLDQFKLVAGLNSQCLMHPGREGDLSVALM